MPTFKSKMGVWKAAHERIFVDPAQSKNPAVQRAFANNEIEAHMYDGPDRVASQIIKERTGSEKGTLGMDARKNPDIIMRARQLGMSVEEYLRLNEPPTEEQLKAEEEKEKIVVDHRPSKRKKGVQSDTGGNFGTPPSIESFA